ncbi:MAG TPA: hypothetical protein VLU25_04850 [Acidobacteriota bacterium]|nr:hypothetical protein [Acidobacteriota bacterium]
MKRLLVLLVAAAALSAPLLAEVLIFTSGETDRGASRMAIFDGHPRGLLSDQSEFLGQIVVNFGKPQWKPEYKSMLKGGGDQKVWRLGADYWTTLEANIPFRLGGKRLQPNQYFLAARYSQERGGWNLLVLDPAKVRQGHLDPFVAQGLPKRHLEGAGSPLITEIPLESSTLEETAEKLSILITSESKTPPARGTLAIRWGDIQLAVDLEAELPMTASE